ncbi:Similar to coa5: Cytochrome c oxidase assembly factor 5 (Xenopus tropicalis) [Cotesia congregata]|uniref:Cytochrome c oxidase assembly factor 5 n=1 Tax=Cotesia congregata TaxID=51543 RepID=A0A8J2HBU3_COTCN|nr:Similar to coa5: Cytochrome c oxidase assembly factor 5 (Xenopus tropicalis) [Cotesia congregata]
MMRYELENEQLKDKSRCAHVRANLKMCLLESDCCKIQRKTPKECLNMKDGSVPQECQALSLLLYDCKRSIIDARRRFRGPKQ